MTETNTNKPAKPKTDRFFTLDKKGPKPKTPFGLLFKEKMFHDHAKKKGPATTYTVISSTPRADGGIDVNIDFG